MNQNNNKVIQIGMNIIFSMAGLYTRFIDAGFETPKYLLTNKKGNTILKIIIANILDLYKFDNILLVANIKDVKYREIIESCLKSYENTSVIFIDNTDGQAHTVSIGIEYLKCNVKPFSSKLVIHNIDTIVIGRDFYKIESLLDSYDGLIDVINSDNAGYSYVLSNKKGVIQKIVEKKVISNNATTGLYCFSDYNKYLQFFNLITFYRKEFFVSDVYSQYIKNGHNIIMYKTDYGVTYEAGTPGQYEILKANENFNSL
jgi:dTDP-glucose pyrophosphorylase